MPLQKAIHLVFTFHHQKVKRSVFVGILLVSVSLVVAELLIGCGALVSGPNVSASKQFGYTNSPLAGVVTPPQGSASDKYFGMTIHHLVSNTSSLPAVPFPPFPIHTFRLWDVVGWDALEPANGQFNWTTMDATIAAAKQNGVHDFIFTLGYVPTWASTNPTDQCGMTGHLGGCDAPNMTAFDDFLTHLVQRYCGVVQYFETWNEPNLPYFWNGTDAQLVTIANDLYHIAKDPANCGCANGVCAPGGGANPNLVLLPPISYITAPDLTWLDAYLAAAGPAYPYADVASFHGYGFGQPEDIVQHVAQLKTTLAKHGLSSLELWDTEASWGTSTTDDQQQEASWLMRFHMAQAASGVSRFVWYAYDNCAWGTLWGSACNNSSDNWQGLRLPGQAYANLQSWMVGATLDHCEYYQDGFWACELQRPGGYQGWMLWYSTGASHSVPIATNLLLKKYRDWQNNTTPLSPQITIDSMPALVEN